MFKQFEISNNICGPEGDEPQNFIQKRTEKIKKKNKGMINNIHHFHLDVN